MSRYRFILLFTFSFVTVGVSAQTGYNYADFGYGIGANVGLVKAYTQLPIQNNHTAYGFDIVYNRSPYFHFSGELQFGQFSGNATDSSGRAYKNNYFAFFVYCDLQLGEIVNYQHSWPLKILKNVYIGTGLGIINNQIAAQRVDISNPTYVFPGSDFSEDYIIPLRIGYEFKIFNRFKEPSFAIDIGYSLNFVLGDNLDGYDDQTSKFKNIPLDKYREIIIGIKYNWGDLHSYKKKIP